ncbi:FAD:protein FMN transferase [Roseimaritima ulvae]|uniref:FAD:protein FMN transferase n=1 Tax=Roseimaritima ulvae TaxID=980254 RepID=A0A5B9QN35_9BACT|nr:FAD:protein FMN transferase [Roseimaritima ulvae]QEG40507.1 Thiamine biosynthesis lipoprotein ApbE precursor [Roseimaritima ulvae]
MATEFVVLLPADCGHQLDAALDCLAPVSELESRLSVYRADSDVSRLNAADGQPCRVHGDVIEVLQLAAGLAERTEGAFDVTAGPLIDAWGFTTRSGRKPTADEVQQAREKVGWQDVQIDAEAGTVLLGRPGMRINLGAIGKGFAIDRVAAELNRQGIENYLLHGGHSTILARGATEPETDPDAGWLLGLQHPGNPHQRLGEIRLRDVAMSTSGPGKQFFHHRGKRYGHVIDPRSGWPAGDLESLTVLTKSATESDALATGLFVCGEQAARQFADDNVTPLYAVKAKQRQGEVEVRMAGGAVWAGVEG